MRVERFGFRVSGLRFRVWSLGSGVWGLGFRVPGSGLRVSGFGFRVSGFGFRVEVSGFGFWVSGYTCLVREQHTPGCEPPFGLWGLGFRVRPGGDPGAKSKSISNICRPTLVAFVWELTKETINLPPGCLQGGLGFRVCG